MKYELTEHELKLLSTAIAIAKNECLVLLIPERTPRSAWRLAFSEDKQDLLRKFIGELHLMEVRVDSLLPQEAEDIVLVSPFGMDQEDGHGR